MQVSLKETAPKYSICKNPWSCNLTSLGTLIRNSIEVFADYQTTQMAKQESVLKYQDWKAWPYCLVVHHMRRKNPTLLTIYVSDLVIRIQPIFSEYRMNLLLRASQRTDEDGRDQEMERAERWKEYPLKKKLRLSKMTELRTYEKIQNSIGFYRF